MPGATYRTIFPSNVVGRPHLILDWLRALVDDASLAWFPSSLKNLDLGALVIVGSEDEVRKWIECWPYWQAVQDKVGLEIEWGEVWTMARVRGRQSGDVSLVVLKVFVCV